MYLRVDRDQSALARVPQSLDQDIGFTVEDSGIGVDSSLVEPLESNAAVLAPCVIVWGSSDTSASKDNLTLDEHLLSAGES